MAKSAKLLLLVVAFGERSPACAAAGYYFPALSLCAPSASSTGGWAPSKPSFFLAPSCAQRERALAGELCASRLPSRTSWKTTLIPAMVWLRACCARGSVGRTGDLRGGSASKAEWVYGFKAAMVVVDPAGIITAFLRAGPGGLGRESAHRGSDRPALKDFYGPAAPAAQEFGWALC